MSKKYLFYIGNLPEEKIKDISKGIGAEGFALEEGWCVLIDRLLLRNFQIHIRSKKLEKLLEEMRKSNEKLTSTKLFHILKKVKEDLEKTNLETLEEEAREYAIREINTATLHELIHWVGGIGHERALILPSSLALQLLKKYKKYITTIQTKDYEPIEFSSLNDNLNKEVRIWFKLDAPYFKILKEVQKSYKSSIKISSRIPDPVYKLAEKLVEEFG